MSKKQKSLPEKLINKKTEFGIIQVAYVAQNCNAVVIFIKDFYSPIVLPMSKAFEIGNK